MTYTKQQVLDHYNTARGTTFTLLTLGQYLLQQALQSELKQMLRDDAKTAEDAQVATI